MLMCAKQFCAETGFPLIMIRRLCRTGILPYWRSGRVYLLDKERTLEKLELLREKTPAPAYMSAPPVPRQRRTHIQSVNTVPGETGTERLRNILKMRRQRGQGTEE